MEVATLADFTIRASPCNAHRMMQMIKKFFFVFTPLLLAGCSTITNLTPAKQERNTTGLYPIEMAWHSREQAIRQKSMNPQVMIGLDSYEMKPTPLVKNRWETLVPVPAGKNTLHYRFKVDYEYNAIPEPRKNSKMSPEYELQIGGK